MKLTINDRFFLSKYVRILPCTLSIYSAFNTFISQIKFSDDEIKKYAIVIANGELKCNDDEYTVEYERFPEPIIVEIKKYIAAFDNEKMKNDKFITNVLEYFKKII